MPNIYTESALAANIPKMFILSGFNYTHQQVNKTHIALHIIKLSKKFYSCKSLFMHYLRMKGDYC